MDFPFIPFAALIAIQLIAFKRTKIIHFLLQVFPAYFPAGASALSKKLPGWEKVKERRGKEEQSKNPN